MNCKNNDSPRQPKHLSCPNPIAFQAIQPLDFSAAFPTAEEAPGDALEGLTDADGVNPAEGQFWLLFPPHPTAPLLSVMMHAPSGTPSRCSRLNQ